MTRTLSKLEAADFINRSFSPLPRAYGDALVEAACADPRIVCLTADLSPPTETDLFRDTFPERFHNVGIAEANMIGMAGGMARSGEIPFVLGDQVRALIILDNNRLSYFEEHLPGVRTVGEAFPGKQAGTWIYGGLAVKAGTPDEIVEKLRAASGKAIDNDQYWTKVPPTITSTWLDSDGVKASLQAGRALYSPILESLGLLHKK